MKLNKLYILIIFNILVTVGLSGQDLHFTHFELAPTLVNPGLAGQFSGTYRGSLVYRDQNRNGEINPYQTLSATVDLPVIRGFRKQDWLGAGLAIARDGAGSAGLRMSTFGLNVAYHLGLDKKQTSILSLGVQMTAGSLTFANRELFFGSVFQSGMPSDIARDFEANVQQGNTPGGMGGGPTRSGSLNDLQVGLVYNARGKTTDFKIGASVEGILGPNRAYQNGTDEKAIGINGFVEYTHANSKRSYLTHRVFYYTQDGGSAINANSRYHYKVNPEKDLYIYGGLGTRVFRSALLFAGIQTGPWRAGLSYDLDLDSSIEATEMHQALEIGVTYLGIINKRPKVDPIIYCPRI